MAQEENKEQPPPIGAAVTWQTAIPCLMPRDVRVSTDGKSRRRTDGGRERQRLEGSEALLSLTSGVPVPRGVEAGRRRVARERGRQASATGSEVPGAQGKTPGWTDAQCFQILSKCPNGTCKMTPFYPAARVAQKALHPDQVAFLLPPGSGAPC